VYMRQIEAKKGQRRNAHLVSESVS